MGRTPGPWLVEGSYFESCNCDPVCPCRPLGDRPGGLSTSGECLFALSWQILAGHASELDLSGLSVVLAGRYWDELAPAPPGPLGVWDVHLYVDDDAADEQVVALADIFLGRAGGDTFENFAAAIGEVHGVRRADIRLDHTPGRQRIDVGSSVTVRAGVPVVTELTITCAIPGHDHPGTEVTTRLNRVADPPLVWELRGTTGFATDFSYRGDDE